MSKIGKQPINIPNNVTVNLNDNTIEISGPRGILSKKVPSIVLIEIKDNQIIVKPNIEHGKENRAMWGTWRSLINNMVIGVSDGFQKILEYKGVGYKAIVQGRDIELSLGFSHNIKITASKNIEFSTEKNTIIISGIDKDAIGQIAAKIRRLRPPEPYKGAGIKYKDEIIKRKEGKKTVGAGF